MWSLVCSPLQMSDSMLIDDISRLVRCQIYFVEVFSDEKKSPLIIDLYDVQCLDGIQQYKLIGITKISEKSVMSFQLSEKQAQSIHDLIKNYLQQSDILKTRYPFCKTEKNILIDVYYGDYGGFSVIHETFQDEPRNPLIVHSLMPVTKNNQMDQSCCKFFIPNSHKLTVCGIRVPWQKHVIEKYYWDKLTSGKPIRIPQLRLHISHITLRSHGIFVHTTIKSIQM